MSISKTAKEAMAATPPGKSKAKAMNEAALDLREQNIPTDELRAIRDSPEMLEKNQYPDPTDISQECEQVRVQEAKQEQKQWNRSNEQEL